jgi:hypothetical protein
MLLIYKFTNIYGFGCNIKGLITILQIKKKLKFDIIVDLSSSIFSNYFTYKTPNITPDLIRNYIFTYYDCNHRINYLTEHLTELFDHNDIILLSTNATPDINAIDDDIKNYIKRLLELEDEIEEYLSSKLNDLPKSYELYHYRIGDYMFLESDLKKINSDDIFEIVKDLDIDKNIDTKVLLKNLDFDKDKENIVIISDSYKLKLDISNKYKNFHILLNKPVHTSSCYKDIDTLIDFLIVRNATSIKSFTSYSWISNFVLWTSIIYDIPLCNTTI